MVGGEGLRGHQKLRKPLQQTVQISQDAKLLDDVM